MSMPEEYTGDRPRYVPCSTYRLQVYGKFPLPEATAIVPYLVRLGAGACYTSSVFHGGPRQHARLRRRQPQRDQPGGRRRRGACCLLRGARQPRHGPHRRFRAEPHGHRQQQRALERPARERPELARGGVLRRRLDADQGRAPRQAAAADSGRPVRQRAGARRAAAGLRERRAGPAVFRPGRADQPAPDAPGLPDRRRRGGGSARGRQPGPARIPEHRRVAAEPAGLHRERAAARRRAPAGEGDRPRPSPAGLQRRAGDPRGHRRQRGPVQRHPGQRRQLR